MYIHGTFTNRRGDTVAVHILTGADRTEERVIGTEAAGLSFTDDPVEITSEVNDTFDHLLRRSAVVRLLARSYEGGFFAANCRDAVVNVFEAGRCVFAGFIEPLAYSQPFNEYLDEIELNCIDALSALQYSKYRDVGALGVLYEIVKAKAAQRTLLELVTQALDSVAGTIDITGGHTVEYLYDGSKAVSDKAARYGVFEDVKVNELLFLGEEEDDVWQQDAVLEEILRYLNLHIVQDGFTFYIFAWETVRAGAAITWGNIVTGATATTPAQAVGISQGNAADTGTAITVGEVYNQLLLTCDIAEAAALVESPLDEDALFSPFYYKQKYLTEYSTQGEGETSYRAFFKATHGQDPGWEGAKITNWYIQVKQHPAWKLYYGTGGGQHADVMEGVDGTHQETVPNRLGGTAGFSSKIGAVLAAIGKVDATPDDQDNAPVTQISMTDCLVVTTAGMARSEADTAYDTEGSAAQIGEAIKAAIPVAEYTGAVSGGVYSPPDDGMVNYIVFSGRMQLVPNQPMTEDYEALNKTTEDEWWGNFYDDKDPETYVPTAKYWHKTVPRSEGNRYYTRRYFKAAQATSNPDAVETDPATGAYDEGTGLIQLPVPQGGYIAGFCPFMNDDSPQYYKFNYSAVGDGTDQISKVSVLACMLVIGDKCLVEKTPDNDLGTGVPYTGDGEPQDFVWRTYKALEQCSGEDEYYAQSFTLGFNPKKGDLIIGPEYEMQDNHSYTAGIEVAGIAVPVRKADALSGRVSFKILGPVNLVWDDITRRHPTFFRSTKWTTNARAVMQHVAAIVIKNFEVKLYSDTDTLDQGNDVIYMSDTKETFVNKKDDLEFRICSDLTLDECKELGVGGGVKLSTPLDATTGTGLQTIYDHNTGETAKAEQIYVDAYWQEWHAPRVILEQRLRGTQPLFGLYTHPALPGRTFYVQGMGRNLMDGEAILTLKETPPQGASDRRRQVARFPLLP